MLTFFFVSFLLGTSLAQTSHKVYSEFYAGADIITFKGSDEAAQLSYASNLFFDSKSSNTTLWFTADEASPNVRSVGFDPAGGNHSFWMYSSSLPPQQKASPFVSLTVLDNINLIGSAFPSPSVADEDGMVIQSVYASADGFNVQVASKSGYEFFSIVSSSIDRKLNITTLYLAGWANDAVADKWGFVVARAKAPINGAFAKVIIEDTDISDPLLDFSCYDIYTANNKPKLWINSLETMLLLAIPGRCSFFAKFNLPPQLVPFRSIVPQVTDPTDTEFEFISGIELDQSAGVLWYALKKYNTEEASILSWDVAGWQPNSAVIPIPYGEADMILSIGKQKVAGKDEDWLFVLASGANAIYRIVLNSNTAPTISGYASLPQILSRVSSAVYVAPYIYFTTYEPKADVARIHFSSFCPYYCGNYSWCNNGVCDCEPQYSPTYYANRTQSACIPTVLHQGIVTEKESSGAASIMGVLFAFALVMAIAGWYNYYSVKNSRSSYSTLLNPEQGL